MGGKSRVTNSAGRRRAAFLRGMNIGRRRITNVELCAVFARLGFTNVQAFLASGNVVFDSARLIEALPQYIAAGLASELQYEVPTFLREGAELTAIANHVPFTDAELARSTGKIQVMLLPREPSPGGRDVVMGLASDADRLAFRGRELYWLPIGNMSASELDVRAIEKAVGPTTTRTKRTIDRIVARYFA